MTGHRHKHAKLVHHYIPKGACVGNNIREQTRIHTHTHSPTVIIVVITQFSLMALLCHYAYRNKNGLIFVARLNGPSHSATAGRFGTIAYRDC